MTLAEQRGLIKKLARVIWLINFEFWAWIEFFVVYAPNEVIGQSLRKIYWKAFYKIGNKPVICRGAILTNPEGLEIGHNCMIGEDTALYVGPCKGVYIGNYVGIGRGTFLRSANHRFDDPNTPYLSQGHDHRTVQYNNRDYSIVIEDDVFIGAHSVILSGTKLGKGCVVVAGSVLSGVFPSYSIIGGNPGRVISSRNKNLSLDGAKDHR